MKNWHKGTFQNIVITFVLMVTFGCIACFSFKEGQLWVCALAALVGAISMRLCLDQFNRMSTRKS